MSRTISANLFMSLDGVVETPESWSLAYWNDEVAAAMSGGMFDADTLLLGRVTYENFAGSWGARTDSDDPATTHMNSVRKYVVSTTLDKVDWNNSRLIEGAVEDGIRALKAEGDGVIATSGSPTLVRSLISAGLLDELRLLVYPIVLGSGAQLFAGLPERHPLELIDSRTLSNGVLLLTYRPATTGGEG